MWGAQNSASLSGRRSNAVRFAIEAACSVMLLLWAYDLVGAAGAAWAVITAILILQPGIELSIAASAVRLVATLLGAGLGVMAAMLFHATATALLAGVLATVFFCYVGNLDSHLRQACLTVPIVQMGRDGSVLHTSLERITAILAGCAVALIVQLASEQITRRARLALQGKRDKVQEA